MNEKISVLIPTFNREKYIELAVRSIINQTYKDLEIIIYDDGSTDKTVPIIKDLAKEDTRIKIIGSKKNRGGVFAKVQLIKESKCDIICYQDSDDFSSIDKIKLQTEAIQDKDLVYCNWMWRCKNKKGGWYDKIPSVKFCAASIMYRKDMNILPNPKFNLGGGDINFIDRYLSVHPKYIVLPKVLYYVRNHEDRVGIWKKKFKNKIPKEIVNKLSYHALLKYYKENYE